MNNEINIVEIKLEDYDVLKDILKEQQLFHYNLNGPYKERFLEINEKNFQQYMSRKYKSITLASFCDDKIIGFTSAYINQYNEGFIEDLFVNDQYRNNSIGTILLNKLLDWLKENNAKTIDVHISTGNEKVLDFYKRFGFKLTGYTMKIEEEF